MFNEHQPKSEEYRIEDTPVDLCTHVVYIGAVVDSEYLELTPQDKKVDIQEKGFQKFADLKKRRSDVKLLLGVNIWSDEVFQQIIATNNTRKNFIDSAIRLLKRYNFDGLAYNWYYPKEVIHNYATLNEETKQAFKSAGHDSWTVSVFVDGTEEFIGVGLDHKRICQTADFVHLRVWRHPGYTKNFTDVPSPMNRRTFDKGELEHYNVVDATRNWINIGCPREKILLKVWLNGLIFNLVDTTKRVVNSPSHSFPDFVPYNKICSRLQQDDEYWTEDWDARSMSPYAISYPTWIGYENEVSLEEKVHFVDSEGLGGLVVDSPDSDDYSGICGKKYPLLTALFEAYKPIWSTDDDTFGFAIERSRRDVGPKGKKI
ncbi:endochitinase-like [Anopheles cruzii]|uniref:endochitinase-like n=1 Tax=Anopheles cruzii TaxID=68878 RepID=UPI0022EC18D3|nr:endochitinase-like [Anopheles cruzii]